MLDLFCGTWKWAAVFDKRGWETVGVDIVHRTEHQPERSAFVMGNVLNLTSEWIKKCGFDFVCASSPCENFSVFDLRMWFPNPKHPDLGIELFNHTRDICEAAGVPYVMENVRAAQQFVGKAVNHCGPFYLWGNSVPPILPQGITKGSMLWSPRYRNMKKSQRKLEVAAIPSELANCVADYAERLLEQRAEPSEGRSNP